MTSAATALTVEHEPGAVQTVDQPVTESAAIFQIISRLASNPAADPDKIERFLAMRDKEIERIAKQAFYVAMAAAQAEMKPVARDAMFATRLTIRNRNALKAQLARYREQDALEARQTKETA